MPSFDVVSELDKHEVTNAVDNAMKELDADYLEAFLHYVENHSASRPAATAKGALKTGINVSFVLVECLLFRMLALQTVK